ncbi:GNAT family N-acetyltransferase [Actinoplanes sp. NPDC049802]|uniref:GNAT family N-acetyltransferase n=1 Tax=Actinoplanes sp. NPDC049802 TaxID=3154742 RepID=UPI0033D97D52
MTWHLTPDVEAFTAAAGRFLLTVVAELRSRGPHVYGESDPILGWWTTPSGEVSGALLRTPPYPLTLTEFPPGSARLATTADRPLLLNWLQDFHDCIGVPPPDLAALADDRLASRGVTLWECDGVPVSTATRSRPEAGMIRIQFVYTPPACRGRGYGGAATAEATRYALDTGAAEVVLFTDLANPTSNALYPRLGYQPIEDRAVVEFS